VSSGQDVSSAAPAAGERPGKIDAVPVRHPGRWAAIVVIGIFVALLVRLMVTNDAFHWSFVFKAMVQSPVLNGLVMGTLIGTAGAMVIGVVLGVIVAMMRLSDNPMLRWTAFAYTWFFRAVPRLVLLTIMGQLGILFPGDNGLRIAVPFDREIQKLLGMDGTWTIIGLDANQIFVGVLGGIIGLGLSEAAYMAEIARAGILSVDPGQNEAASALGMSKPLAMRRVVLPQAMRVIVPPTGNETIAMVKDTSLLIGIPVTSEVFFQLESIGSRTYETFPVLVAAVIWYLIVCSVLMVVQSRLEKYFGRGFGGKAPNAKDQATRARILGELS
jgi:polar amino acid transport system permease protein